MGWLQGDDTAKSKSRPSSSRFSSLSISQLSLDVSTGAANVSEVENDDDDDDDDDDEIGTIELGIPLIPVDLFVRKKKQQKLTFTDAFNNIVFHAQVSGGSSRGCLLLDSSGRRPLLSILPYHGGNWRAFKGDNDSGILLFTVKRTLNTFGRIELNVVPSEQNGADSSPAFKLRGSVFWRSFCIYRDDAIIAQTSLMYTLGFRKVFVSRSKFRITVFPGFSDQTLIAGLVLVFLDGRK